MAEKTIADAIEEAAKSPSRVSVDGLSVDGLDIEKAIKAKRFLAEQAAASKNHCGLTFRTLEPGGCG